MWWSSKNFLLSQVIADPDQCPFVWQTRTGSPSSWLYPSAHLVCDKLPGRNIHDCGLNDSA